MIGRNPCLFTPTIALLVGTIAVVPVARAQHEQTLFAELSQNAGNYPAEQSSASQTGSQAPWPYQAPRTHVTRRQLDAFAALAGESTEVVWQRLAADPGMIPLAIEAADARMQRQRRGRTMMVLGFSGFGVGTAAAILGAILWSKSDSSKCQSDAGCLDRLLDLEIIVVGGAAAAGGFVLGFCGVDKTDSQSEAETKALDRYKPLGVGRPPSILPSDRSPSDLSLSQTRSLGKSFRLPLLSFTF